MPRFQDMDPSARSGSRRPAVHQLNAAAIKSLVAFGAPLIDIRDAKAYASGHIPGAVRIAAADLSEQAPQLLPRPDRAVAVVCSGGDHSLIAAQQLEQLGYTAVVCLRGGLQSWPDQLQQDQTAA